MMSRNIKLPVLIVFTACIISGCFGFSNPDKIISYYTLEYDAPKIQGLKPLPFAILIENFQVVPTYDSNKIIYRNSEFKREAYSYHRWRTNPGDMVTHLLARDFKETSLFKAIFTLDSRYPATHILKGTIEEFYEKDEKDYWESVLSLSVTLIKKDEIDPLKSIIFQNKYNMKEVCSKKNPQSFAQAMSKSMEKLSGIIIKDVYNNLIKQ